MLTATSSGLSQTTVTKSEHTANMKQVMLHFIEPDYLSSLVSQTAHEDMIYCGAYH